LIDNVGIGAQIGANPAIGKPDFADAVAFTGSSAYIQPR
jgi:hypothetical protein